MTRPKPKTVKAWAFAETMSGWRAQVFEVYATREIAIGARRQTMRSGWLCGPVVRIEVPAPKERKR